MPVAQPYGFYTRYLLEFHQSFSVGCRVDEDAGPLDIDGMTVRILAFVFPGDKPYRAEMLFFNSNNIPVGYA